MIKLDDEILNRFIDGELDAETAHQVSEQIKLSHEDRVKYEALKTVHLNLKNLNTFEVSSSFTSKVMAQLIKPSRSKKEQKVFILSIGSVFVILMLLITGSVFSSLFSSAGSGSSSINITDTIIVFAKDIKNSIGSLITARNTSIFGSIIAFGVIISAFFFFENLRHSKE